MGFKRDESLLRGFGGGALIVLTERIYAMNILVVGGGGREHAIIAALAKSPKADKIYCAPGNGGIAQIAQCVDIKATDIAGIVAFAAEQRPGLVVIGPDDPLVMGMADAIEALGIPVFGPNRAAAQIEGSKSFAKALMQKYGIPTAKYEVFEDAACAIRYIEDQGAPIVIKADGLALGKGVTVAATVEEAIAAVKTAMEQRAFGDAGKRVVIEECLSGPEVSVLCFADGQTLLPMPSSQDHKRAYDGDKGPNTGGMGVISPSRHFTKELQERATAEIMQPTIEAMAKEGHPFKGCLYFGLMLTKDGPKVIEYNARFGDPETQAVLPLLKSDLVDILLACAAGTLDKITIEWEDAASCCVVLASGGYPGAYQTGYEVKGLNRLPHGVSAFHAGTKLIGGKIATAGGRVLGITAQGKTLEVAIERAYVGVAAVEFEHMHVRKDIGKR